MVYVNRRLLGQQRDKLYREALRLELAEMGVDLKKLREIARVHIEKAAAGDMQAIKELADRLDGRPAQILEHSGPETPVIRCAAPSCGSTISASSYLFLRSHATCVGRSGEIKRSRRSKAPGSQCSLG
jgi:hypothetical protein